MTHVYSPDDVPSRGELVALYDSVGWTTYTRDPERLAAAVGASLRVVPARADGVLVGLARAVGDGLTIVYVQEILVAPLHQRAGVGRGLVTRLLEPFSDARQKVLLTDAEPGRRAFYESLGFTEIRDMEPNLRSFVRFG